MRYIPRGKNPFRVFNVMCIVLGLFLLIAVGSRIIAMFF